MRYISPQDLKSFGLIPEIIGRLPVLTHLNPLDREALRRILVEPKNSIVKQYEKLFEMDGIKLIIPEETLNYVVDRAVEYKLGARGLRSIVESMMRLSVLRTLQAKEWQRQDVNSGQTAVMPFRYTDCWNRERRKKLAHTWIYKRKSQASLITLAI